jgi:hypothetical protein
VRRSATGSRGGVDVDSPRRGDCGLRIDTAGTPAEGGDTWSLCEPYGEDDGEVSAVARKPYRRGGDTLRQRRTEKMVGLRHYSGARRTAPPRSPNQQMVCGGLPADRRAPHVSAGKIYRG